MQPENGHDVLIIGSGAAGLTAALVLAEKCRVLVLAKGALDGGSTKFSRKAGDGDLKRIRYLFVDEYQDFTELFPEKGPREVKKILTKLVNEEVLEFWSSGSTTMYGLKGAGKQAHTEGED